MKLILAVLLAVASPIAVGASAQEISLPSSVVAHQRNVPDTVAYASLFRQAATFKDRADELDRQGLDGSPYRRHLAHKLKLTPSQVIALDAAALQYRLEVAPIEQEIQESVRKFQEKYSTLQPGQPTPLPPPEAKELFARHEAVAAAARDRLHTFLGDEEFNRIDPLVKERVIKKPLPVAAQSAQGVAR